ncbi:MAG: hypothetical protein LBJ14_02980 [Desulfarculales bacterium]|nr:hypothetical protein [Desulfarculales bacterium]
MAQQTPPPGAKIIDLVNVVGASPSPSPINDDDLDNLLAKLDSSSVTEPAEETPAPKEVTINPPEEISSVPSVGDDLDSLLNDLAAHAEEAVPSPAPPLPETAAPAAQDDDFEDFNPDDLESLLQDINQSTAPAGTETKAAAIQPPPEKESSPAAEPAFDTSELDALLNELGAKTDVQPLAAAQPKEEKMESAAGAGLLDSEDLDSLLAEIAPAAASANMAVPAPAAMDIVLDVLPEPTPAAAEEQKEKAPLPAPAGADMDILLSEPEEEANLEPAVDIAPPEPEDNLGGDDLDALLADLENNAPSERETVEARDTAPAKTVADDDWDLDINPEQSEPERPALPPSPERQAAPPADSRILTVSLTPEIEAVLARLTPHLERDTVREVYQAALTEILNQVVPKLVDQEVSRQIRKEIEAIKRLAGAA